jgi:uncharacterized protein
MADTTADNYSYVRDTWTAMDGVEAGLGGVILGVTVSLLWIFYGRLTGISGMFEKVIKVNKEKTYQWQLHYLSGLYGASYVYIQCSKTQILQTTPLPSWLYVLGGLCVGFGTRLGCGCTSGHGLSGLSRFSVRSFAAVCSFFVPAVLVANLVHGSGDTLEGDFNDPAWYQSNTISGATLMALSLIPTLRDFSPETIHVYIFGALFGIGLSLSGMVNNTVVLSFLNFNKFWNPALMFVLAFGSGTFAVTYWLREHWKSKPLYADENSLPAKKEVDMKLIAGGILFGIGWGLCGLCPGPAIAAMSVPAVGTIFIPSVVVGMKVLEFISTESTNVDAADIDKGEDVNINDVISADP